MGRGGCARIYARPLVWGCVGPRGELSVVDSVHCPVCMIYFHNRFRVLNHLKYRSSVCRLNFMVAGPLINNSQSDFLDEECRIIRRELYATGLRAHAATAPCFRLCGPLPPPLIIDGNC